MIRDDGAFQRAPRPLIGWGGVALIAVCILFLLAVTFIAVWALWRWSNGEPVDLMGFAALVGAAVPAGTAIWRLVEQYLITRHWERMDQQQRGVAPAVPFVPSPPSSGDAMVNPHGGPGAP